MIIATISYLKDKIYALQATNINRFLLDRMKRFYICRV